MYSHFDMCKNVDAYMKQNSQYTQILDTSGHIKARKDLPRKVHTYIYELFEANHSGASLYSRVDDTNYVIRRNLSRLRHDRAYIARSENAAASVQW